ncbi:hypothetical protein SLE2022_008160 [Rubroshorea leprosula]
MEKEGKIQRGNSGGTETDFVLQWGNRKRLRCFKLKKAQYSANNTNNKSTDALPKRKLSSFAVSPAKESSSPQLNRLNKNLDLPTTNRRSSATSPEKEDRYYATRGSLGLDDTRKVLMDHVKEDKALVWPKLFTTLSSKEKEEDFMAMKGCKLPQRPKKRAKLIQKSILLVSPGAWLSDLCQERYEVREKKTSKRRPRGLKAMGSMESDSE